MPTELSSSKKSVCSKDAKQKNELNFELGVSERIDLPVHPIWDFNKVIDWKIIF